MPCAPLAFRSNALPDFPEGARLDAGYLLDRVQRGHQPDDCELIPVIGNGVERFGFRALAAPIV